MSGKPAAVVTGGAGFIGSHMVDALLAAGFAVRVVDNLVGGHRSNLEHLKGNPDLACYWQDIRALDPDTPIFAGARYVFHLAGIGDIVPSIEQPTQYMDTNVQGTVRVLECARHAGVEKIRLRGLVVLLRACRRADGRGSPDRSAISLRASKHQGEQAVFHWQQGLWAAGEFGLHLQRLWTRVRTTGVYGAVFGVFFRQKLAGKPYTVGATGPSAAISSM